MPGDTHAMPALVELAVEPRSRRPADRQTLVSALATLAARSPAIRLRVDEDSGQIVVGATSEAALQAALDGLRQGRSVGVNLGEVQVAYAEHLTRRVEVEYPRNPGTGVAIRLVVQPDEPGTGCRIETGLLDGRANAACIRSIERGVAAALAAGVIAGFPVVGITVTLRDAALARDESLAPAFEAASRAAVREAMPAADPVLLEPVMRVEVTAPDDLAAAVCRDLADRGGRIQGRERRRDGLLVTAEAPLALMLGYADELRRATVGRAVAGMAFARYAPVPRPDGDPPSRPAAALRA